MTTETTQYTATSGQFLPVLAVFLSTSILALIMEELREHERSEGMPENYMEMCREGADICRDDIRERLNGEIP